MASRADDVPVTAGRRYLRRRGRAFAPVGAHVVPREGPDWPWRVGAAAFERAFEAMAALGLDTARIDVLWSAVEPVPGRYDEDHLEVLDQVLRAARRHGLLLHPALLTGGEVGDAYWDVDWRRGRHPHRDPTMVGLQADHVAALARRWRGDPALLAWDLTDEPPFWPFRDTVDDEARAWTARLARAIRDADPGHLVTIGTASQEVDMGPFRADVVASDLDFVSVHPYPIYSPELYPDGLLSPRMTRAAAFETALAGGVGRPVMLHEYGASTAQFDPERIAAYDRLLAWSALGRGACGFLAWCWTDAEPAAARRAPYVRAPHEMQFGVTDEAGLLRPRGRVLAELAATVREIDLDGLAADGPAEAAAIIVPHEYVHPYDPAGYGLGAGPAGLYVPAEAAADPQRDPAPLVEAWLNAFVLADRAGMAAAFPRERLDGAWPDARVVLLPAPLSSTTGSLHHVRTAFWDGAAAHLARGGSAWVSCSADTAIPGMTALLGAGVVDRADAAAPPALRFVRRWGPFAAGDDLVLPGGHGGLAHRSATLAAAAGSDVVAVDATGEPALVVAPRGRGWAVVCSHPVELLLARTPDAHGPGDRSWGLYAGLRELADAGGPASVADAETGVGALTGPAGGLAVVTNHGSSPRTVQVHIRGGAGSVEAIGPGGSAALERSADVVEVDLAPYGAAIVAWRGR